MSQNPAPPTSDAIAKHTRRFYGDDGSPRITALRAEFEEWYVVNAFDYARDPIDSDVCDMQWRGWKGSREIAAQPGEGDESFPTLSEADGVQLRGIKVGTILTREQWSAVTAMFREGDGLVKRLQRQIRSSPPHVADALDGGRYRWLRDNADIDSTFHDAVDLRFPCPPGLDGFDTLDQAIDAAIAARAEAGEKS